MPWFALQDDNIMNLRLAALIRRLRSDAEFSGMLDTRIDEILKDSGTLIRNADGCLASPATPASMEKISQVLAALPTQLDREGFTERAAEALRKQGLRAWRNHVGHIAVDPAGLMDLEGCVAPPEPPCTTSSTRRKATEWRHSGTKPKTPVAMLSGIESVKTIVENGATKNVNKS
jgi:hypothetical protein